MKSFDELLQHYVNLDYEELVEIGTKALADVMPMCKKVDTEHDGALMLSGILVSAIGADGNLSYLERKFLRDLLRISDENVDTLISLYCDEVVELVDNFVDNLGTDVKASTLTLVIAVAACDETISRSETAFIAKLLA